MIADLTDAPIPAFLDMIEPWDTQERDDALWHRCRSDLELFCLAYFPERFNKPFSQLHRDLILRPKVRWTDRRAPERSALAAPRGSAKSTIVSFADIIHDIVYGYEIFVGMISTDYDLSESLVKDIYSVLTDEESYPAIHATFGPFKITGTQTDFVCASIGAEQPEGTKVKAYSMGGACRGHKHRGRRFSKWVLDDIEHPKKVLNPKTRDEGEQFLDADVGKSGDDYTTSRLVGTLLHPDSVLSRKLADPEWTGDRRRALIAWPKERDGLWEECRALWTDLSIGPEGLRREAARWFYEDHRATMDEGAEVAWPDGQPLFGLMVAYWASEEAFYTELQNEPSRSGDRTFDISRFAWCTFDGSTITTARGRKVPVSSCRVGVWLDPKPANPKRTGTDFAAIAVVARDSHGGRYVLDCEMRKDTPLAQRARLWSRWRQWGTAAVYGYENNQGTRFDGEDFRREQKAEPAGEGLNPRGYQSREDKSSRIARIQPDAVNGFIQFSRALPAAVIDQFRHFPQGRNDDGPDAIERADWLVARARNVSFGL